MGYPVCRRQPGNRGVLGLAPAAEILPIRVVGPDLTNQEAVVLANQGIAQATADQADVICYAGPTTSRDQFAEAIAAAQAADVVVVAGTGNLTGGAGDWFPAANPAVLAVGSDRDLSAPPYDLLTTAPERGYEEVDGSDAAAAVVAGAAALVRAAYPDLTAAEVVHRLVATANPNRSLNLVAALTADVPPLRSAEGDPAAGVRLGPFGVDAVVAIVGVATATAVLFGAGLLLIRRRSASVPKQRPPVDP